MNETPLNQEFHWLLEVTQSSRMYTGMAGYIKDIEQTNGLTLALTNDAHKAIKFHSESAAQSILDDLAFIHAYGPDHGIKPVEHGFIGPRPAGDGPRSPLPSAAAMKDNSK